MKIYCIIPAFDETGNLAELTKRLTSVLKKLKITYKIFFVLQGEGKSRDLLRKISIGNKRIDYVYYPQALGIGLAYKIGFEKVVGDWTHVLTLDADLNHQPEELPKLIRSYKKTSADFIVGSRFIKGGEFKDKRFWKIFTSRLVNLLINKICGVNILDKTSGYRLIRTSVIARIRNDLLENGYPSYAELILLVAKYGYQIYEVPITYIPRSWGKSKMGKLKTSFEYFLFIIRLLFSFGISTPKVRPE